jgi:predicted DCC family thiol-disulfide oxidoreductase YuxK
MPDARSDPEAPFSIVLFDGVCGLCTSSVRFIVRRDKSERFRFASLRSQVGIEIASAHGLDSKRLETLVLIEGGKPFVRSDAALRIARRLRFPWCLFGLSVVLPGFFRDLIYKWIASHRYRWFGRLDGEWMAPPDIEHLFL